MQSFRMPVTHRTIYICRDDGDDDDGWMEGMPNEQIMSVCKTGNVGSSIDGMKGSLNMALVG